MIIPKPHIKQVYQYLLNEGVLVVKKDFRAPKHTEIEIPNLEVLCVMKSLKSRGYVTEQFSWQHHFFTLTDEGIVFLRNYLHLPETVVPTTIAKANRSVMSTRQESEKKPRQDSEYRREWRQKQTEVSA